MKKVIDNLNTVTGWTGYDGASIHGLNQIKEFIAGNNTASLIFKFEALNSYVEKIYTEDLTDYNEIIFWIYSQNNGKDNHINANDYSYKINLGESKEIYVPIYKTFYWIRLNIKDISSMERIRLISLHSNTDFVVMSYFLISKFILPLDIFQAIKEQIEYEQVAFTDLKNIGQITGVIGDTFIEFVESVAFLDRYFVIKISDGVNSEIHHIKFKDSAKRFSFSGLYDGDNLLYNYTDADVFIYYPVEFGTTQKEIVLPSITVWGFAPEKLYITNELDKLIVPLEINGSFKESNVGDYFNWELNITCEVIEEWELLGEISNIVRSFLSKKILWINGRKGFIDFVGAVVEMYPDDVVDIIPKIQYPVNVIIREDLHIETALEPTIEINFDAILINQGVL